jgi:hypothetical protein
MGTAKGEAAGMAGSAREGEDISECSQFKKEKEGKGNDQVAKTPTRFVATMLRTRRRRRSHRVNDEKAYVPPYRCPLPALVPLAAPRTDHETLVG